METAEARSNHVNGLVAAEERTDPKCWEASVSAEELALRQETALQSLLTPAGIGDTSALAADPTGPRSVLTCGAREFSRCV